MKKTISDVIHITDIESWKLGDSITIIAGTGAGKSYFIKNDLYEYCRQNNYKILFLIHRTYCIEQFQNELDKDNKTDVIDIKSYQYIETLCTYDNNTFNFNSYRFIVCDEFHYFFDDSQFNTKTDLSLETILKQNKCIKIFMSATGWLMKKYLKEKEHIKTIDYSLPIDFSFIKSLTFYDIDETLDYLIQTVINNGTKAIFFIWQAKKAYSLFKRYKDYCLFNCSKSNDKYYKYVDADKIDKLLVEENLNNFDESIIITTTAMDSGLNIHDPNITAIVVDGVKDINVLIQCIGRKRQDTPEDKISLAVRNVNNQQLGGIETISKRRIEKAEFLINGGNTEGYVKKFFKDTDNSLIVYDDVSTSGNWNDCTKKVNKLMYYKTVDDIKTVKIIKRLDDGYKEYISDLFDKKRYKIIDEEDKKITLKEYLESSIGIKLLKDQQKELIDRIDHRVDGRQQKSYKKLNIGLEMINLPYEVLPGRTMNERYWTVVKKEKYS